MPLLKFFPSCSHKKIKFPFGRFSAVFFLICFIAFIDSCKFTSIEPEDDLCGLFELKNNDKDLIFTPADTLSIDSGDVEWTADVGGTHYEGYTHVERDSTGKIVYYLALLNSQTCTYGTPVSKADVNLESVFFVDEYRGWIVGEEGTIKRTIDGGETWTDQISKTGNDLYDVCFVGYDEGFCVGDGGIILATTNGGLTWEKKNSGTTNSLYSIDFNDIEPTNIYIVGKSGTILFSSNSGFSWNKYNSGVSADINCVSIENYNAVAVGAGGLILVKSSSSDFDLINGNIQTSLNGVIINGTNAIAVGAGGAIIKSLDLGQNWVSQSGASNTLYDTALMLSNPKLIMACGTDGLILYSISSGNSWSVRSINTQEDLKHIQIVKNAMAVTVGTGGSVYISTNGGINWNQKLL